MGVAGIIPCSFVDWPGHICSVLFMKSCRWRCYYCHNKLISWKPESVKDLSQEEIDEFFSEFRKKRNWLDGITISGGEPTDDPETLFCLLDRVYRAYNPVPVKLDTNGSNPNILRKVVEKGLVSAVYMDVKEVLEEEPYSKLCGVKMDIEKIKESLRYLASKSKDIEVVFRTTVDLRDGDRNGMYVHESICELLEVPDLDCKPDWKWITQPLVSPVFKEE